MKFSSIVKGIALTLLSVPLVPTVACNSDSGAGSDAGSTPDADGGSATFSCDSPSKCPNDPPTDKTKCEQSLAGPCGAQFQAFSQCALEKQQCGADGMTDNAQLQQDCSAQSQAYRACASPTDGGGEGGGSGGGTAGGGGGGGGADGG